MRYGIFGALAAMVMLAAAARSYGQDQICTPCGDTVRVVERKYESAEAYRNAIRLYDLLEGMVRRDCELYLDYKEAYEKALRKYDEVTRDMSYPEGSGEGNENPMKRFAGNDGVGHVGFDFSGYAIGSGMDTLNSGGAGRLSVTRDGVDVTKEDEYARRMSNAINETFLEFEEFYGVTPEKMVFTGNITMGSEYRWYSPMFSPPVEPKTPDSIEKPVFEPYYGMYFHPRPLAPCDNSADPVIGDFSFSRDDFFRKSSEFTITLSEFYLFPEDLKARVPGAACWEERAEKTFGKK